MAHHYSNSLYDRLADRLNQFPQGAPLSDSLFAIETADSRSATSTLMSIP